VTYPFFPQLDAMDCGATCLRMICRFYGRIVDGKYLREQTYTGREGVSMLGLSRAAEELGFKTLAVKIDIDTLINEAPLPAILHWNQEHFVVLYKIKNYELRIKNGEKLSIFGWLRKLFFFIFSFFNRKTTFFVADPAHGKIRLSKEDLKKHWCSDGKEEGIALLLETTPAFYNEALRVKNEDSTKKSVWGFIWPYFRPYNGLVVQLFVGLLVGSLLQFIFPFLTQSIVDIGVRHQNIHFIYLVLMASLMLFVGQTIVELVRSRILLHISSRVNISLISDFLLKLMKLPISFFDSKMTGDLMQRIGDHGRIQSFMTGSSLSVLFSVINLFVFGTILLIYDSLIFMVFFIGSAVYTLWILFFLKYRKELDYKRFQQSSVKQSSLIQIIQGMQEIKLQNAEQRHRWNWEKLQAQGFKIELRALNISNIQSVGSGVINQLKNIIISVLTAKLVIDGKLTLGMMLSVQYIIGQLNAPIAQLLGFVQQLQDATLSLERLNEIHSKPNEENAFNNEELRVKNEELRIKNEELKFENVSFRYAGPESPEVLKNLNFTIPSGKVTAIVGSSGSGKTTLLKLLMKFYTPTKGTIKFGNTDLSNLKGYDWRDYFGAVLQDGFIFSDTIARNIAVKDEIIDRSKLLQAVRVANIEEFIESLPLGFNTKIGQDGIGVSMGQRQRLLIARAVYKEPSLILFDEATNSLDANNERKIVENMNAYLKDKTAVIVAHRLSTVKDADNIIVLDKGEIIEQGTHDELTAQRGAYYTLIKNQLELGS
jgi:ATP-binding cassette subfamily B protein